MIAVELTGVRFGIAKTEGGVISIAFEDEKSGWRFVVPFTSDGWSAFKRHVAADGEVPAIEIASSLNGGMQSP